MKEFQLSYYSATAMEIPSLGEGVRKFEQDGGRISVSLMEIPDSVQALRQRTAASADPKTVADR